MKLLSHVPLFATLWTVARQAPLSMGFSRQEYWSGLPFPFPRDLPNPGIEPWSPALWADALSSEPPGNPITLEILQIISKCSLLRRRILKKHLLLLLLFLLHQVLVVACELLVEACGL